MQYTHSYVRTYVFCTCLIAYNYVYTDTIHKHQLRSLYTVTAVSITIYVHILIFWGNYIYFAEGKSESIFTVKITKLNTLLP